MNEAVIACNLLLWSLTSFLVIFFCILLLILGDFVWLNGIFFKNLINLDVCLLSCCRRMV
ncbi:hypothetical protein V6Z11_A13G050400 [Gossypium hirsutum]